MPDIRVLRVDEGGRAHFSAVYEGTLQVSGIAHLAQTIVNHVLTTPGSDRLNQSRGAGLADLCRRYRTNSKELQDKIADRIETVNTQIKNEQEQLNLRDEEKLESLTVVSATPDENKPTRLNIVLAVRSKAGDEAQIVV
jgi:hypothetical protein